MIWELHLVATAIMSASEKWPPWDYTARVDHSEVKVLPLKVPEVR